MTTSPGSPPAPNAEATELLLTLARERVLGQEHAWNAHRTKAGFILAASAATLGQVLTVARELQANSMGSILALALLGAVGTSIASIWPRAMNPGVKLESMLGSPVLKAKEDCVNLLMVHYIEAVKRNEKTVAEVAGLIRVALGCLSAALAILIFGACRSGY